MSRFQSSLHLPKDLANHRTLGADEERRLAESGHLDELVRHNVRLAVSVVLQYDESKLDGMDANDLFQLAMLGISYAADKWDPSIGNRFTGFGARMARNFINKAIEDAGREVRIPPRTMRRYVSAVLDEHGIPCRECEDQGLSNPGAPIAGIRTSSFNTGDQEADYYCPRGHKLNREVVRRQLAASTGSTVSVDHDEPWSQHGNEHDFDDDFDRVVPHGGTEYPDSDLFDEISRSTRREQLQGLLEAAKAHLYEWEMRLIDMSLPQDSSLAGESHPGPRYNELHSTRDSRARAVIRELARMAHMPVQEYDREHARIGAKLYRALSVELGVDKVSERIADRVIREFLRELMEHAIPIPLGGN